MGAFRETIAGQFGPVDPSLKDVLGSVEKDLSTFLASDLLNSSQAEQVVETSRRLCAELAPKSLGLPEEMLQSPIASDWVGYNAYDNQGELQTDEQFQEVLHKTVPDLSMGYNN